MKGIILAGGKGTRLHPLTKTISKQLLPVYNKPMIYYPLQTLKDMGITEILVITADKQQKELFQKQLKHGEDFGLKLGYAVQENPNGLPEAFIIGEDFINGKKSISVWCCRN
jgi:glucose-1-phosphate thymidylyltransferase